MGRQALRFSGSGCAAHGSWTNVTSASARYALKDFRGSSHDLILRVLHEAGRPLRILEIGTADGYLTRLMAQQGHHVVGVDSDQTAAAAASIYCEAFHLGDIEGLDLDWGQRFDCLILADVLEHLRDPASVLMRLRSALAPQGCAIVSVPNVAHLTVRLGLLAGRFQYADRGILDRGHLRFFTLTSLLAMLADCGFCASRVLATPAPVQLVLPFTRHPIFDPVHRLHLAAVACRKTLLAYQFVVVAEPDRPS
jgi:SAM-dependent methyltransferase